MIRIDGSTGEGGGQILRTALSLSLCTGQAFRIERIRARRRRPGLQPQHLAAVQAAAAIGQARVQGAEAGSGTLEFAPGPVRPGNYRFDIGTAGSTTLVLQTVLPPLMLAAAPSRVAIEGGTHNPMAPPFEFLQHAWRPLIERMGPRLALQLERPGFYPAGGGLITAAIEPVARLAPLQLDERGPVHALQAEILLCHLPRHIAERERSILQRAFDIPETQIRIRIDDTAPGPGNAVSLFVASEHVTEVFTAIGRRGLPAEKVAGQVVTAAREYLSADVPVGRHLADQLLLPLALAGEGRFATLPPSRHTTTNITIIRQFLDIDIRCEAIDSRRWQVHMQR